MTAFPSINPSYGVTVTPNFNTLIINYGNKVEQRIALNVGGQSTFKLSWKILTPTDKETIYNFFIARLGATQSFTWTNVINNVTYTVRFKQDSINFEYFDHLLWELNQVELIEVST